VQGRYREAVAGRRPMACHAEAAMRIPFPAQGAPVPDVRRIAVLRANALGDLVFALPALDALRHAYPGSELVLLGRSWHRHLLDGRGGPVDRVIELPDGVPAAVPAERSLEIEAEALRGAAAERFDIAIQLHGGGRTSNPIVLALGARVTAGCRTHDAPALDRTLPYIYYQSEVMRNLEVVGLVGAPPVSFVPSFPVLDSDRVALERSVPGLEADRPLVVLHPGASDPRRRWPAASFAAVGDLLAGAGARIAVTGSGAEAALTSRVVTGMRQPALDLGGRLDLPGLVALLERAAVVVSNDTGPLHLAGAVGTATVGIFWCSNLINAGPAFRSLHRPAISWRLTCPACGVDYTRGECPHRLSIVAEVPVDQVASAALALLAEGGSVSPRPSGPPVPNDAGPGVPPASPSRAG
jgi:ADP-heptose:LPS heptosyltransferase